VRKNDLHHTGDLLETRQGGTLLYSENSLDAIKAALVKFLQQNDTKASPAIAITYAAGKVRAVIGTSPLILSDNILQLSIALPIFYDGPTPSEVFDDFLAIPTVGGNVTTRTFSDLILSLGAVASTNGRRYVIVT
jgi:hypothetical protein